MTDQFQEQIDEMNQQYERITEQIQKLQSEPAHSPQEHERRTQALRKLRRDRGLLQQLIANLHVFRLGGVP